MHRLLLKAKADPNAVAHLVMSRDLAGLTAMLRFLRGEAPEPAPVAAEEVSAHTSALDEHTQKQALRAFRKRLRLVRLDHESRLGVGPMSSGKKHEVDAIEPPGDFPMWVWT